MLVTPMRLGATIHPPSTNSGTSEESGLDYQDVMCLARTLRHLVSDVDRVYRLYQRLFELRGLRLFMEETDETVIALKKKAKGITLGQWMTLMNVIRNFHNRDPSQK